FGGVRHAGDKVVDVEVAETAAEGQMLLRGQALIVEEYHQVVEQRPADFRDRAIVERLCKIDPRNLGAERSRDAAVIECVSHPSGHIRPQARRRPFPVTEQDGLVWVWPGDPTKAETARPPRLPEIADAAWETADTGPMSVPANSLLLIENLLDITHFYPLHDGNIGDVENSRIPFELDEGTRDGNPYIGTIREARGYRQPPFLEDYLGYDIVDRDHTHYMLSPAVTRVEMRVWPAGQHGNKSAERGYVIVHTHTPIDRRNHVWRLIINMPAGQKCKSDPTKSAVERFMETFPAVIAEDRWALEKQQQMFDYPDDGYSEVFLRPDIALRRARQILMQLEQAERNLESPGQVVEET